MSSASPRGSAGRNGYRSAPRFIPPILLLIVAGVALVFKSDAVKLSCLYFMLAPFWMAALGPLYSLLENYQSDRRMQGDDDFRWPAQRNLAHAIKAADVAKVKGLIPRAGNLYQQSKGETLLRFAVYNVESPATAFQS